MRRPVNPCSSLSTTRFFKAVQVITMIWPCWERKPLGKRLRAAQALRLSSSAHPNRH